MTTDRWLAIVFLAIGGLISWFITRYYYSRGEKRRAPTFVIRPERELLATSKLASLPEFSVTHKGAPVGTDGITEVQIYFWNSGTLPILHTDVLEPFAIEFPGKILSSSLLKLSRDVIRLRLSPVDQRLDLTFELLEPGDGATLQIVYDGAPNATVLFSGVCVGAPKPLLLPPDKVYFISAWERFLQISSPLLILPISGAAGLLFSGILWLLKHFFGEHAVNTFGISLIGAIFLLLVAVIGQQFWRQLRKMRAPYLPPDVRG